MNTKTIIIIVIVVIVLIFIFSSMKNKISTREPYQDLFYAKDYAKDNWVARPTFRADLSPRFDAERMGNSYLQGQPPGLDIQGAPLTPVSGLLAMNPPNPSYATMGGSNSVDGAYADQRLPDGGLSTSQVNEIIANKFGRNAPAYTDPAILLPVPDMKKALARDPSDPGTFLYDRFLFAPLLRRYGNVDVDHIRGE
jgi:hypothetical protein